MSSQYVELRPTNGWDPFQSFGHPSTFQRVSRLGSVTAWHSSSGRQPNFAALNRGRHLHSTGRPSRLALAHILVLPNLLSHVQVTFCASSINSETSVNPSYIDWWLPVYCKHGYENRNGSKKGTDTDTDTWSLQWCVHATWSLFIGHWSVSDHVSLRVKLSEIFALLWWILIHREQLIVPSPTTEQLTIPRRAWGWLYVDEMIRWLTGELHVQIAGELLCGFVCLLLCIWCCYCCLLYFLYILCCVV